MDGPGSLSLPWPGRRAGHARCAALIPARSCRARLDLYYITYNPCSLTNRLNKPRAERSLTLSKLYVPY